MLRKIRNRRKVQECSESSANLFSSNLALDQPGNSHRSNPIIRRQDSAVRQRNIKIIERLLSEFDMEETIEKYSSQSIVEVKLDPNKCSYDTAASTVRLRDRLHTLMGSDVIRLNDRKYSEELGQKLQEEYEANMRRKEQALAKAEKDRVRKLMLEGVIPMDKEEDPFTPYRKARSRKQKSRKHSGSTGGSSKEVNSASHSRSSRATTNSVSPHRAGAERVQTQVETFHPSPNVKSRTAKMKSMQNGRTTPKEQMMRFSNGTPTHIDAETNQNRENIENGTKSSKDSESMRSRSSRSSSSRRKEKFKDNPLILNLMEEESVTGLYKIAAKLVPPPDR